MEILYILFSVYTKQYLYNVLNTYCIYFFIQQMILRPINRTKMQSYRRYQTNISSIIENNFQFRYNKCFYLLLWEIYTFFYRDYRLCICFVFPVKLVQIKTIQENVIPGTMPRVAWKAQYCVVGCVELFHTVCGRATLVKCMAL